MSAAVKNGAEAFKRLIGSVGAAAEASLIDSPFGDEGDARDYRAMSAEVLASLQANVVDAEPAHREGFLRALTDLLCIVGDGCGPGDDWDPVASTQAAFCAPHLTAETIRRAAQ